MSKGMSNRRRGWYKSILSAMEQAIKDFDGGPHGNSYYDFFVPGMRDHSMRNAVNRFAKLFALWPKFHTIAGYEGHGSVRVESYRSPGLSYPGGRDLYPSMLESCSRNVEVDMLTTKGMKIGEVVLSVEEYNEENPTTPPRYELLLNYPSARMLLLDRETLDVPEGELRNHFFRKD